MIARSTASVLTQQNTELIVVVNGSRFDPELVSELMGNAAIRVIQLREGNVSVARSAGLVAARGEYFGFIDDDDEYLADAIATRVALFRDDVDVVVTSGHYHQYGMDGPLVIPEVASPLPTDPIGTCIKFNWFASPASLFRTSTVPKSIFDITIKYYEWTYLHFKLLSEGKRILSLPSRTGSLAEWLNSGKESGS